MLQLSGDAKYADVLELSLYNSVLSGVSLDGNKYFYTNPLSVDASFPYQLRWQGGRQPYISKSNCCPPNTVRTIAEAGNYMYSISKEGIYCNLYGGNHLTTQTAGGEAIELIQESAYPWDGAVRIKVVKAPTGSTGFFLRIPGWCKQASLKINGKPADIRLQSATYASIRRQWKSGDLIELNLAMPVTLIESNPLVEETRNQVTVKRGPIVYCLESADLPAGKRVSDILIPSQTKWTLQQRTIAGAALIGLQAQVLQVQEQDWTNKLYRELNTSEQPVTVQLIPYFAWANRGQSDMSVWLPVKR